MRKKTFIFVGGPLDGEAREMRASAKGYIHIRPTHHARIRKGWSEATRTLYVRHRAITLYNWQEVRCEVDNLMTLPSLTLDDIKDRLAELFPPPVPEAAE